MDRGSKVQEANSEELDQLIVGARSGDHESTCRLEDEVMRLFWSRALWLADGNRADAEDLIQEVYLRVLKARSFEPKGCARNWLYTLLQNIWNTWIKKRPHPQLTDLQVENRSSGQGPAESDVEEFSRVLLAAFEALEPPQSEVLALRALGNPPPKVCELIGLPARTERAHAGKARRAVESFVERKYPEYAHAVRAYFQLMFSRGQN